MAFFLLLRPKQWSKNLLVFAALLFTGGFSDPFATFHAVIAFVAMCLMSSAVYILNDQLDIERDRAHPTKRNRPLASGAVTPGQGYIMAVLCLVGVLICGYWLNTIVWTGFAIYVAIQVSYNIGFKRVAIGDVFCIALGFVLRAVLGAAAISQPISPWLLLCTGSLALMFGFAKRRHEFLLQGENRSSSRESLTMYSKPSLDALVMVSAATASINYSIYCVDSGTARRYPAIILTALPVFYGIGRYLLRVFSHDEGGEPADLLFGDFHLLGSVVIFVVFAFCALSGAKIPLMEAIR